MSSLKAGGGSIREYAFLIGGTRDGRATALAVPRRRVIGWRQHRVPVTVCVRHGGAETKGPPPVASRDGDRAVALSRQLVRAHDEMRRRIREIRTGLGHRRLSDDVLLTHCLAFCTALTSHHQGEDNGMFSQLLRERPDLAPTITKLVEDHGLIASILSRVGGLADRAAESPGAALEAIGRELDGLAAIMESHFGYEERTISKALDERTPDTDWPDMVFGFGET
ncbi:hemerythrin domain-containing protein [Streptomyces sp. NPDC008092]|uniref:hemerythrin domain-containing protein n=1 Tax=Streptomyces sp. NPDC008092 TaxID=3364808 RepID=UPI0036E57574